MTYLTLKGLLKRANQVKRDNPMVNEFGIIILLRRFWVSTGKEKVTMRRVYLSAPTSFRNSQW